ncbi:MAG: hypothetical protein AB7F35_08015 [Acetobacteraceae bacterium]
MLSPSLRNWFGRADDHEAADATPQPPGEAKVIPYFPPAEQTLAHWPIERIGVVDGLWGEGFVFPGGELETMRLAKPLGLSAASSLLLLGAGGGGPACTVARKLGVWVSGFEADPELAALAAERVIQAKLGRRAQVDSWDPAAPEFARHYFHHGLALEPLRGAQPEPMLAALAAALKPGGQLSLMELVADAPLDPSDPTVARWATLEDRRPETLPTEVAITRILRRLGFDVRIVEDVSARHMQQALLGWRTTVRDLEFKRPTRRSAALLIQEAELWLLRMRLFQGRRLRLIRWHAIGRGT